MAEAPAQRPAEAPQETPEARIARLEEERRQEQRKQEELPSVFLQPKKLEQIDEDRTVLEEYKELCETIRVHGNMRFAILTVFVALTGGLVYLLFGSDSDFSGWGAVVFKGLGIAIALIFWQNEYRTRAWHMHFQHRAAHLERVFLGFNSFSTGPEPSSRSSTAKREPSQSNSLSTVGIWRRLSRRLSSRRFSQSNSLSTVGIWAIYLGTIVFWLITIFLPGEFRRVTKEEKSISQQQGVGQTQSPSKEEKNTPQQ